MCRLHVNERAHCFNGEPLTKVSVLLRAWKNAEICQTNTDKQAVQDRECFWSLAHQPIRASLLAFWGRPPLEDGVPRNLEEQKGRTTMNFGTTNSMLSQDISHKIIVFWS